jgi:hypothetical protein
MPENERHRELLDLEMELENVKAEIFVLEEFGTKSGPEYDTLLIRKEALDQEIEGLKRK